MRNIGLLLIVIMLALSGCASSRTAENSASQLQTIGEKYLAAGDIPNALRYLTQAEAKRPDNPVLLFDLGLAYHQRGLSSDAISRFKKALQIKPVYPEAQNALGVAYAEAGQTELARECFEKVLADPFYHTPQLASFNLARIYEKNGENERALRLYEQAVRFQTNYGAAWYRMGILYEAMGNRGEARNAYGKAITASPEMADAHLRYGQLSFQAGDLEAAFFSLNKVVRLVPNSNTADEARLLLEKVRTVMQKKGTIPGSRSSSSTEIEIFPLPQEKQGPRTIAQPKYPSMPPGTLPPGSMIITPTPGAGEAEAASPPPSPPVSSPSLQGPTLVPKPDSGVNKRSLEPEPISPSLPKQPTIEKSPAQEIVPEARKALEPESFSPKQAAIEKTPAQETTPESRKAPEPEPIPSSITKQKPEEKNPVQEAGPAPVARIEPAPSHGPFASDPFSPSPAVREAPVTEKPAEPAPSVAEPAPAAAEPAHTMGDPIPSGNGSAAATPKQQPQFNYVVQVGSFEDKEKADEIRGQLLSRGYRAIIRPVKDRAHGRRYIVQLKPESTYSKANTLMIQLGSEVPGSPVIVKVPADGKSAEPGSQQN
ncbi:MAG: tetratricopeptide repeat protein [Syntrophobacter sp.]